MSEKQVVATCPECGTELPLAWDIDWGQPSVPVHRIATRSCESGGVYGVYFECGSCPCKVELG